MFSTILSGAQGGALRKRPLDADAPRRIEPMIVADDVTGRVKTQENAHW